MAPTIARNDPAFPDQFYWRGDIWGPTNYMLYEGINRYGSTRWRWSTRRRTTTFSWTIGRTNQHDNEQYYAWGGTGGGDTHYTWGALLCLVALEQYIDKNPWEGLRFGALSPASSGEFRGSTWDGHTYDVAIGPERTALCRDGAIRFEANTGVVVRQYQVGLSGLSFKVKNDKLARLTTSEFASGEFSLKIDGKATSRIVVRQGRGSFEIPPGEHSVELGK